jgi:hypothetical protein
VSSSTSSSSAGALPYRRYLVALVVAVAAVLGAVGTVNVLADASHVFGRLGLDAFAEHRLASSRTGRGEMLQKGDWQVLLLGTSRILHAVDPEHPSFGGRRVMNGGLKGTNLFELALELDYAIETTALETNATETNALEEVVLFLDFHAFNATHETAADFQVSRLNPAASPLDYYLEKLFGMRSLQESVGVLRRWQAGDQPSLRTDARRREVFEILLDDFLTNPTLFRNFGDPEARIALLGEMLRLLGEHGIATSIVIVPVHASMLETIRVAGLWPHFEAWKRSVLATAGAADRDIPVWDFTGYDAFSTEAIPYSETESIGMRWFRDPSHMRKATGDLVLDRVSGDSDAPGSFGVRLSAGSLDRHLARIRSDRSLYLERNRPDVAWVEEIASRTRERTR